MARPPRTTFDQTQIRKSKVLDDGVLLGEYEDVLTLEQDLNYIRTILKQIKGTSSYDSPLTRTLQELSTALENASFENAALTGIPTAPTPVLGDNSTRIATTEFVTNAIDQALVVSGSDSRYRHSQVMPASIWTIIHNLGKNPSVSVVDSSGEQVGGLVKYIDNNSLTVTFSAPFGGEAFLN